MCTCVCVKQADVQDLGELPEAGVTTDSPGSHTHTYPLSRGDYGTHSSPGQPGHTLDISINFPLQRNKPGKNQPTFSPANTPHTHTHTHTLPDTLPDLSLSLTYIYVYTVTAGKQPKCKFNVRAVKANTSFTTQIRRNRTTSCHISHTSDCIRAFESLVSHFKP